MAVEWKDESDRQSGGRFTECCYRAVIPTPDEEIHLWLDLAEPDEWQLSAHGLLGLQATISATTPAAAQAEALGLVRSRLRAALEEIGED